MSDATRRAVWLGARIALLPALSVAFLVLLGLSSVVYVVDVAPEEFVVQTFGTRYSVPRTPNEPAWTNVVGEPRFSTRQLLFPEAGPVGNGVAVIRGLLNPPQGQENDVRLPLRTGTNRLVHWNPFRARLNLRSEGTDANFRVTIPDASLEIWIGNSQLVHQDIAIPWPRLILAPLGAVFALAAFLATLVSLASRRRPVAGEEAAPFPFVRKDGWICLGLFALGALAIGVIFHRVFEAFPGFGDEMNYLFQAKIFASGHLSVPEPPDPQFFKVAWMDLFGTDGRIWGFHPPGNSVLLMLGTLVGMPDVTIPIVGGLLLVALYLFALEVLPDRRFALLCVLVCATSHYFLSLASSYMAHAPSALCLTLGSFCVLRFTKGGRAALLPAGAALFGAAFLIRPVSAVLLALPIGILVLVKFRFRHLGTYALAILAGLVPASGIFVYTHGIAGKWDTPYAIKGPEMGQTISVRLGKGTETHEKNLFRNVNEYQHRVHSFGILGNLLPAFLPLFLGRRLRSRSLIFLYGAFLFFCVGHSVLHWHGWKWEPRMLYDVSFLFYVLSALGLFSVVRAFDARPRLSAAVAGLLVLPYGWVALKDLPARFATEYEDYNISPKGVLHEVQKKGIHEAIVLFRNEEMYTCYMPQNSVTFDGDVVYAKYVGALENYRLLARFPKKQVFYSHEGMTLQPRTNFFRKDLDTLAKTLRAVPVPDQLVVLPWLEVAPTPLHDTLPGRKLTSDAFLSLLPELSRDASPRVIALAGDAVALEPLLASLFRLRTVPIETESPVVVRILEGILPGSEGRLPGFLMTCYGDPWYHADKVLGQTVVAGVDPTQCPGNERSAIWEARFTLAAATTFELYTESDDGSGIFLDGDMVLDNELGSGHGVKIVRSSVCIDAGEHLLTIKWFNGPGEAYLEAGTLGPDVEKQRFSGRLGPDGPFFFLPRS
ncbi:MAG: hypothetical protein JNK60_03105 [Acidobacteria bacterium]|nr:hypothetical protein [Acidobacteriota bacterium]